MHMHTCTHTTQHAHKKVSVAFAKPFHVLSSHVCVCALPVVRCTCCVSMSFRARLCVVHPMHIHVMSSPMIVPHAWVYAIPTARHIRLQRLSSDTRMHWSCHVTIPYHTIPYHAIPMPYPVMCDGMAPLSTYNMTSTGACNTYMETAWDHVSAWSSHVMAWHVISHACSSGSFVSSTLVSILRMHVTHATPQQHE